MLTGEGGGAHSCSTRLILFEITPVSKEINQAEPEYKNILL